MKTQTYNKPLGLLIVLAILGFMAQDAWGQNLVNKSGAKVTNVGIIRFVEDLGEFQNEGDGTTATQYDAEPAGLTPASGTIQFMAETNLFGGSDATKALGYDDGNRINGWVSYAATAGTQNVQGRYYSNLSMADASTKDFGAELVYVDHIYTVLGAGDRNYNTSTFYYDGANAEDQTIFPESNTAAGNNIYYKLYFDNAGIKTIAQGDVCNAINEINLTVNTPTVNVFGHLSAVVGATVKTETASILNIYGDADGTGYEAAEDGIFTTTNGAGLYAGTMYIYNEGTFETKGTGNQVFTGGDVHVGVNVGGTQTSTSGSFTLEDGDAEIGAGGSLTLANLGGHLVVGAGRTLTISNDGDLENTPGWGATGNERSNFNFDDASFIHYTGSDQIEAPTEDYPYGTLLVSGAQKTIEDNTIAFISEDFGLADNDLLADGNGYNDGISREALAMLDETASATFGDDLEVIGKVRRYFNGSTNALTFNNTHTQVTVTDGTPPTYLDLSVWKDSNPTTASMPAANDYNATTDVNRKTVWDYELNGGANFTSTLRLAWRSNETTLAGADLESVRMRESENEAAGGINPHKIATGNEIQRVTSYDQAGSFSYVELAGLETNSSASVTSAYVADGNEIYLRGGPTWFITINPGRWSNPDTWDEGVQPGPFDYTMVRHTVWAGFNRLSIDGDQPDESTHLSSFGGADATTLCAYIWIYNNEDGAGGEYDGNGTLIFGGGKGNGPHEADSDFGITVTGAAALATVPATLNGNDYTGITGPGAIVIDAEDSDVGTKSNVTTLTDLSDYAVIQTGANATTLYNGGLVLFNGATFTIRDQGVNYGTITNAGTIIVGTNP